MDRESGGCAEQGSCDKSVMAPDQTPDKEREGRPG